MARDGRQVALDPDAADRMRASREVIERLVAEGATVYGVTTGFGDLANVRIEPDQVAELQRNLVRSHTAGVGEPLPVDVVRAMLLLRANALAIGLSGVRPDLAELLCGMLNEGVHPVIPSRGSVGASGDLAPLAHLAAVMIGEGWADSPDGPIDGGDALSAAGLAPLELGAKEGLALLNGTQLMTAIAALVAARRTAAGGLRRRHRRHEPGGDGGDRGRLRRGADRRPAAPRPGGRRRPPAGAAGGQRDRERRMRPARIGSRTPTRCAACRRSTARCATRSTSWTACWRSR